MSAAAPASPLPERAITRDGAERMGFFTDTTTCIGCKACEVACKQWNDLPQDLRDFRKGQSYDFTGELSASTWRHVRFIDLVDPIEDAGGHMPNIPAAGTAGGQPAHDDMDLVSVAENGGRMEMEGSWVFMSDVCKHCTHAGCLDACPTGALIRTEFDTVILQPDVCNGCGYCVPSCPFGVVDRDHTDGRAAKCTLCYDRLEDGLEPACAKACPTDSIQFGRYEELVDIAQRRVVRLKERGIDGAYLYGAGDEDAEKLAGGLGAFFLLTHPPERYGLPAHAESPIQENVVPATLAAMGAGALAAAGVAVAFLRAAAGTKRRRAGW